MRFARHLATFALAMSWPLLVVGQPGGQPYPSKPVHVIVPFTAGSATDILARTFGQKLSELWGQPVIVDNRPGAGGTIGAAVVAQGTAGGYTLLVDRKSTRLESSHTDIYTLSLHDALPI